MSDYFEVVQPERLLNTDGTPAFAAIKCKWVDKGDHHASETSTQLACDAGFTSRGTVTCTDKDTDYTLSIPDSADYLEILSDNDAVFAIDQVTTSTVGAWLFSGKVHAVVLPPGENRTLHVQSKTAGTEVKVSFRGQ